MERFIHAPESHATELTELIDLMEMADMTKMNEIQEISTFTTKEDREKIQRRRGAYLPHWTADGGAYHVRFRLHDSIPTDARMKLRIEREELIKKIKHPDKPLTVEERRAIGLLYSEKVDQYLDAGHGECWLKVDDIAKIVANALKHFENERYHLYAWCIMPNHVHAVIQPVGNHKLSEILYSWKSFTSKEANKILGRTGKFWQQEYYDRLIRTGDEFEYTANYVMDNPDSAGFKNWKWKGRKDISGLI